MVLDEDDIYVQEDAFLAIYQEAEKNNLDVLSFGILMKNIKYGYEIYYKNFETSLLFKPDVAKNVYNYTDKNEVIKTGGILVNYLIKTELAKRSIKQIEDKFLNSKINYHDDLFIYFIIIRNANSFKGIKRIFYFVLMENKDNLDKIRLFRFKQKKKNFYNLKCFACIKYLEFLLIHTENSIKEKKIASSELKAWYFNNGCKSNKSIRNIGKSLLKLYLNNKFIDYKIKDMIRNFLKNYKVKSHKTF